LDLIGVPREIKKTRIVPDASLETWADDYLFSRNRAAKKFVAVIPGGGASWGEQASRKRWYAEGFIEAADAISARGFDVLVLGDASEKALCGYVASGMKKPPAAVENGLSLKRYISLLSRAGLVLCNDGGPLHIAVALGVKTVSVFGPVDERVYGPYPLTGDHRVIKAEGLACRPCYDRFKLPECEFDARCITDVSPHRVAEACVEVLNSP
jgi:ADP-heptose:LPS heptosyltransferase